MLVGSTTILAQALPLGLGSLAAVTSSRSHLLPALISWVAAASLGRLSSFSVFFFEKVGWIVCFVMLNHLSSTVQEFFPGLPTPIPQGSVWVPLSLLTLASVCRNNSINIGCGSQFSAFRVRMYNTEGHYLVSTFCVPGTMQSWSLILTTLKSKYQYQVRKLRLKQV